MGTKTTTAITTIKQEVQLHEWAEQISSHQASGLSVQKWCAENGMNPKTYYYRLRKVREQCIEKAPAIVSVAMPKQSSEIHIEKNSLQITLPTDISSETLIALIGKLC